MTLRRARAATALVLACAALLAGCAGTDTRGHQVERGSLAEAVDLSGQTYVVGGKDFDEQILLCEITIAALESAGASVTNRCNTGSTEVVRNALLSGEINIYWEYTGTAWATFFKRPERLPDEQLYDSVRQRDLAANQVMWLARSGFNDTYAFAVNGQKAAQLGLHSISDMANYLRSGQPGTICVEPEYHGRADGLPGLQAAYGVAFPPDRTKVLEQGLIYQSTADGVCTFGEVFTTDGRIPGLGLTLLRDDKHFHATYDAVPTVRKDAFDRNPAVAGVLDPISQALDAETIQMLNAKVSSNGMPARDVARAWLVERGFVAPY